jgi:hypothetical protein
MVALDDVKAVHGGTSSANATGHGPGVPNLCALLIRPARYNTQRPHTPVWSTRRRRRGSRRASRVGAVPFVNPRAAGMPSHHAQSSRATYRNVGSVSVPPRHNQDGCTVRSPRRAWASAPVRVVRLPPVGARRTIIARPRPATVVTGRSSDVLRRDGRGADIEDPQSHRTLLTCRTRVTMCPTARRSAVRSHPRVRLNDRRVGTAVR